MSYPLTDKTMHANINIHATTFNELKTGMREQELLSIHQMTYTSHEPTKHAHMDEYMYKNENK
jgi:hypothetical protein